ncbi:MAG: helix-turn-helix domain-containing protein [Thermoleophilia bacterium]
MPGPATQEIHESALGQRLKKLRLAHGFSLDELVAEIGGIVSKQALSNYERDKAKPSPVVLNKLAVAYGLKSAQIWSEPRIHVQFVAYRKTSSLGKREQEKVESLVTLTLEDRVRMQELTGFDNKHELPVQKWRINDLEEAEHCASELRNLWDLGIDPIACLTDVFERHFVHVIEISANEKFDGIAAFASDEDESVIAAAVVSRSGLSGERQRLNLAHELGHLVLDVDSGLDEEKAVFRFAAALLAPAESIYKEVGTKRAYIQPEELLLLKRCFGMSVQALVFRLHDLNIINDSYYKQWWIDISRLGWRRHEPMELAPEEPKWLRQNTLRAFSEGLISESEASRLLQQRVEKQEELSLIERRAFLSLPIVERRRIMEEQARKAAAFYEKELKIEELQGGDLIEY